MKYIHYVDMTGRLNYVPESYVKNIAVEEKRASENEPVTVTLHDGTIIEGHCAWGDVSRFTGVYPAENISILYIKTAEELL